MEIATKQVFEENRKKFLTCIVAFSTALYLYTLVVVFGLLQQKDVLPLLGVKRRTIPME